MYEIYLRFTNIQYDLSKDGSVKTIIYDILGNVVNDLLNENQTSGFKSVRWDATDNQGQSVFTGVYLFKIETKEFIQLKKMLLVK